MCVIYHGRNTALACGFTWFQYIRVRSSGIEMVPVFVSYPLNYTGYKYNTTTCANTTLLLCAARYLLLMLLCILRIDV